MCIRDRLQILTIIFLQKKGLPPFLFIRWGEIKTTTTFMIPMTRFLFNPLKNCPYCSISFLESYEALVFASEIDCIISKRVHRHNAWITWINAAPWKTKTSSKTKNAKNCNTVIIMKFPINRLGLCWILKWTRNQEKVNKINKKHELTRLLLGESWGKNSWQIKYRSARTPYDI